MYLKCIACEVIARPLYLCAAYSPHIVDIELVKRGLHNTPARLRAYLQDRIDQANSGRYDALLFGYGLCGQALSGLRAGDIPLVIPRAHDCITLFLGSRQLYAEQFREHPGTYWYVQDYIERDDGTGTSLAMGSTSTGDIEALYSEYVEKYGRENADYLMEVMGAWQQHYQRAVYIDMGVGDGSAVEEQARQEAARRGWTFERMAGDLILIRRLINGDWDQDFLIVEPGQETSMAYDEQVLQSFPCTRPEQLPGKQHDQP